MEKFALFECLKALRADLTALSSEGEGKEIKFQIEDVALEFNLVAGKSAEAGAGVKWWIVSADAGGSASETLTQKLSLRLKVTDPKGRSIPMGDHD